MSTIIGSIAAAIRSPTRLQLRRGPRGDEFLECGPGGAGDARPVPTHGPSPKGWMDASRATNSGRLHQFACRPADLVQRQPRLLSGQSGDLVAADAGERSSITSTNHWSAGRIRRRSLRNSQGDRRGDVADRTAPRADTSPSHGRPPGPQDWTEGSFTTRVAGPGSRPPHSQDAGDGCPSRADALGQALGAHGVRFAKAAASSSRTAPRNQSAVDVPDRMRNCDHFSSREVNIKHGAEVTITRHSPQQRRLSFHALRPLALRNACARRPDLIGIQRRSR